MTINIKMPSPEPDLKPRITVIGVGGAGGNAVNNMIEHNLEGVEFVVGNSDAQALSQTSAERRIQLGRNITQGLGAGSRPDVGKAAAEEAIDDIIEHIQQSNMVFITAGMGGGTGTGAAPVIARASREQGILTVGVVTKPFQFEGLNRMKIAEEGIEELQHYVDTLIITPNQNLFRIANEKTTFAQAFEMADNVLYSGVRGVTDLMVMPGLINLDFADVRQVMSEMGKAMMGTGEADCENRAIAAAEAAISNPLLDDVSMEGAKGVLINISGGDDMTLFEVDEAANRIRSEVDPNANIIFGSTFDPALDGRIRISVIATGIDAEVSAHPVPLQPISLVSDNSRRATSIMPTPETAPAPDMAPVLDLGVESKIADTPAPAPAPQATPGIDLEGINQPFMPPAPVEAPRTSMDMTAIRKPDPMAEADIVNAGTTTEKPATRPSLFERVTGSGRAKALKAEQIARTIPAPTPAPVAKATPAPVVPAPVVQATPAPVVPAEAAPVEIKAEIKPEARVEPVLHPRVEAPILATPEPAPMPTPAPEPQVQAEPEVQAQVQPEPQPEPKPEPQKATQQDLGGLVAKSEPHAKSATESEEDLLEIPAFLRRQAN
ncbi:MAG: cell division protein FtsZ [Rhodospirillales bacterium]|nr:cell division protein FtsZ [Rhodospirillales bacterium]